MSNKIHSFEDLECWKVGRQLRVFCRKITKELPKEEQYRLSDQIVRASRSITANIAEGFGRFHFQENIQFCRQSRGSLTELLDHFIVALDEGYISESVFKEFKQLYSYCLLLLNGYIQYLGNAKNNSITTGSPARKITQ
jgi:four helix bundle protein